MKAIYIYITYVSGTNWRLPIDRWLAVECSDAAASAGAAGHGMDLDPLQLWIQLLVRNVGDGAGNVGDEQASSQLT